MEPHADTDKDTYTDTHTEPVLHTGDVARCALQDCSVQMVGKQNQRYAYACIHSLAQSLLPVDSRTCISTCDVASQPVV